MPNRHYCGPRDEIEMGDCNPSHYTSPKNEDKFCKYSYSSWCSTCERNSPRRRSRSETNEPCRRRCKEMKTLTPKKYNRCQEYENMEFEYETKGQWQEKDMRFECCRIRSNLCELPTSYISNNCQMSLNLTGLPRMSSDTDNFVECLKSVTSYEQTLKFVEFNSHLENLGTMQDKSKPVALSKPIVSKPEHIKNGKRAETPKNGKRVDTPKNGKRAETPKNDKRAEPPKNGLVVPKTIKNIQGLMGSNQKEVNVEDPKNGEVTRTNCREFCPLVDFKLHDLSNRRSVCYDTETYFDRKNDTTNLKERYSKEVEYLREKLKTIRDKSFKEHDRPSTRPGSRLNNARPTSKGNGDEIRKSAPVTPAVGKGRTLERKMISPPLVKIKSRVGLKTRAKSNVKLKKAKSKSVHKLTTVPVVTDRVPGECSGSDSEIDDYFDGEVDSISDSDDGKKDLLLSEISGSGDFVNWPVRPSLFPNIPPYINFSPHDALVERRVPNGRRFFKWKLSTITPVVVRKTLTNSGFALVRKSNEWLGTWGKHMKSPLFKTLKETQKLNHFPGTFQLGRKDRLWRNFQKMIARYGNKEFGFIPHTYILPQELRLLKQNWEYKDGNGGEMWIIKPPASARGAGIKVINRWTQVPKRTSLVVQRYISDPYLINGSKFDLRLYVLITSFNPLRIYLYPDGLARFASDGGAYSSWRKKKISFLSETTLWLFLVKYSDDVKDLVDRYMHLTNYSINKMCSLYTANEDANKCQGHKWTISKLMEYLEKVKKVDTKQLWRSLQQLVIKTIIACEPPITQLCDDNMNNNYNCYELFGVDVLLDEQLKPWLLEVNISPSLHSASPLDSHVKGPLVRTLFDLVQFHLPPRLGDAVKVSPKCYDARIYTTALTKKEREKHIAFNQYKDREDYLYDILKELTGDDVRHLARAEDEFVAKGKFERIFPTAHTHRYLNFMEGRYYNRLFDAWETKFAGRRKDGIQLLRTLCAKKMHLKVAIPSAVEKKLPSTTPLDVSLLPSTEGQSRPLEEIMQETSITNTTASTEN